MATPGKSRARGILSHFTRHRTLANLLLVLMILAGVVAGLRIRSQFFPDNVVGTVTVSVLWSGAGPEEVDRAIVQALEPALLAVEGVESTASRSREGAASITVTFEPDWDMGRASDEVQAAVDSIRTLPDDAELPEVRRGNWRDRVTDVVITGPLPPAQLAQLTDELTARLFAQGITRTTIQGIAAPRTMVRVPTASLMRHGLTMREIAAAIAAEVQSAPAGDVAGGTARVVMGTERRSADQIAAIILRRSADGTTLTVGDIAGIEVLGADRNVAFLVGDNPAMQIRVDRSATGDAITMQAQVQAVVDEMQLTVPQGVNIDLVRTRAESITDRLNLLLENGLMGLGLVLVLLFLFLNARTAIWVAAGIPVSMAAAVAVMYGAGLTINMMSLFALIITLGVVVDDAIVVAEHADHRARNLGEAPFEAAENAAIRMASPVFASTLTTVIAFAGLFVVGGTFGTMIADIPFTVVAVLIASLVECFLILPNHMAHALASTAQERWYDWPSRQFNRGFGWVRARLFRPLMALVVRARYPVLALAVLALASQAGLFLRGDIGWRFFNSPEQGSISGNFSMLPGATRADTMAMVAEMQRATRVVAERYAEQYGTDPISYVTGQIGGNAGRGLPGSEVKEPDLLGSISIELIDPDLRPYSSFEFLSAIEAELHPHPKVEELSFRGSRFGPGGDALSVQLTGADAPTLKAAAEALKRALAPFPAVSALEDNLTYDKDEIVLTLTPQGEALGFTAETLGRLLRERLNGIEAATYPDGPRSAEIRVELPESELTADFLDRTYLRAAGGTWLPLADVVRVEMRSGFSTVRRENGLRVLTVTGDISEDDPAASAEVRRQLTDVILPRIAEDFGVGWQQTGLAEQESDFLSDAVLGLILCLTGIYLVLAWIFASWTRPLVVMSVIPFGLVGAIWGHYVWGVPLSMFSIVGLLGMSGIIITDSIVLVDAVDELAATRPLHRAIIDGASDRLRAVTLTTTTTVAGLAPLLYETSSQALFLKPTVITLVYGLGFGMGLVLLVVPALIAAQSDVGRAFRSLRRGLGQTRRAGLAGGLMLGTGLAVLALFVGTLGWAVVTGALPGPLAHLLRGLPPVPAAALLFLGGTVALAGLATAVAALSPRQAAGRSAGPDSP
ncbi:MAG: efflux RND transporter permease subunit [Rhodobacterales bacterium]|nr:efflux RND transporter permease subunit [Rhodobacterales bacterium]MDX5499666.1 efflux RND transporter permease subunit [Rhodobacterales bacterium]